MTANDSNAYDKQEYWVIGDSMISRSYFQLVYNPTTGRSDSCLKEKILTYDISNDSLFGEYFSGEYATDSVITKGFTTVFFTKDTLNLRTTAVDIPKDGSDICKYIRGYKLLRHTGSTPPREWLNSKYNCGN
jgi:hypothetical protein